MLRKMRSWLRFGSSGARCGVRTKAESLPVGVHAGCDPLAWKRNAARRFGATSACTVRAIPDRNTVPAPTPASSFLRETTIPLEELIIALVSIPSHGESRRGDHRQHQCVE